MCVLLTFLANSCCSVHMSDMEVYRILGVAIAKRRAELGLTQADVAGRIDLTRASLANIETGRQKVLLHQIYKLANALEVRSITDLVPPLFQFIEDPEPVQFEGSDVNDRERAQLEHFVRTFGSS